MQQRRFARARALLRAVCSLDRSKKVNHAPPAKISPGTPAPTMGPGTALGSAMKLKSPKPIEPKNVPVMTFIPGLRRNVPELKLAFPRAPLISSNITSQKLHGHRVGMGRLGRQCGHEDWADATYPRVAFLPMDAIGPDDSYI